LRRKEYGISESDLWDAARFGHMHEHIDSVEDYDKALQRGLKDARNYLSQRTGLFAIDEVQKVHGLIFGEIYGSSGEFKLDFDPHSLPTTTDQLSLVDSGREEKLEFIAEHHVDFVKREPFRYGSEEVANLLTERRMEVSFGERSWQGLDEVDSQNWNQAVERGDTGVLRGFLENQLQDAINYEENPLGEFQDGGKEKLTRKEIKEAKVEDRNAEDRLAELNAKGESYKENLAKKIAEQKKEQTQVNLALENLPKPQNNQSI